MNSSMAFGNGNSLGSAMSLPTLYRSLAIKERELQTAMLSGKFGEGAHKSLLGVDAPGSDAAGELKRGQVLWFSLVVKCSMLRVCVAEDDINRRFIANIKHTILILLSTRLMTIIHICYPR
jgi:hypothetical protein